VTPHGDHWLDLTATLCRASTDEFGDWISRDLAKMERQLYSYVTHNSLQKSLRRQSSPQG
jgi:hypothetical protein